VAAAFGQGYWDDLPVPIYISTNAGGNWTQTTSPLGVSWSSVACSADGLKLVATASLAAPPLSAVAASGDDGLIYLSPDAGATWTPATAPTNHWTSVASSADGTRLVAAAAPFWDYATSNYAFQGGIYRSSDGGATWARTTAPNTNWTGVASSAEGTKLVAVSATRCDGGVDSWVGYGQIYSSLDSGATWKRTSAPSANWSCAASSADGTKIVASIGLPFPYGQPMAQGGIYSSSDSGATWILTRAPSNGWGSVACSADGSKFVAGCVSDVYTSNDSGANWTPTRAVSIGGLTAVACSADGYRLVAAGLYRQLCTWPYSGPWRLANAPPYDWESVACSADGTKLVAAPIGTGSDAMTLYSSGDSGATWTQTSAPTNAWWCVASSADGAKLVAVTAPFTNYTLGGYIGDGGVYCSSNAGLTWTRTSAPSNFWRSVVSSIDGTKLVASAGLYSLNHTGDGAIYSSSDSGTTWIRTSPPTNDWHSVAASSDGTKLVAVADGPIYVSADAGVTWTLASAPSNSWSSVASSADGTKLVAAANGWLDGLILTYVYTSGDSGATWEPTSVPTCDWFSVASSADGTVLCALGAAWNSGDIEQKISTNSGVSWAPANLPASGWWGAASAYSSGLVAAGDGQIATLHSPPPAPPIPPSPQLAVNRSGGNLDFSWLVPSTPFVLQQTSDLRLSGWVEVPASPTLNLTNLHYQLTLPPTPGNAFYRLKLQ